MTIISPRVRIIHFRLGIEVDRCFNEAMTKSMPSFMNIPRCLNHVCW